MSSTTESHKTGDVIEFRKLVGKRKGPRRYKAELGFTVSIFLWFSTGNRGAWLGRISLKAVVCGPFSVGKNLLFVEVLSFSFSLPRLVAETFFVVNS
jgi:hypothetical protein